MKTDLTEHIQSNFSSEQMNFGVGNFIKGTAKTIGVEGGMQLGSAGLKLGAAQAQMQGKDKLARNLKDTATVTDKTLDGLNQGTLS